MHSAPRRMPRIHSPKSQKITAKQDIMFLKNGIKWKKKYYASNLVTDFAQNYSGNDLQCAQCTFSSKEEVYYPFFIIFMPHKITAFTVFQIHFICLITSWGRHRNIHCITRSSFSKYLWPSSVCQKVKKMKNVDGSCCPVWRQLHANPFHCIH